MDDYSIYFFEECNEDLPTYISAVLLLVVLDLLQKKTQDIPFLIIQDVLS